MDWLQIEWEGPYTVDGAKKAKVAQTFGLYAIHRRQRGREKLVYVGRVYWQSFAKRLSQHRRDWLDERYDDDEVAVYFGVVRPSTGRRISFERVADAEGLLIHELTPPHNTASKRGYKGRDLLVINTGKVGDLDQIVTSDKSLLTLLSGAFKKRSQ